MRTTSDNSIGSNMKLAMDLWPNATWTDHLQDLWRERLTGLNQDIVHDAIRLVKPMFSSHQPELKWVLSKCSELAEQRNPRFLSGNQRPTFWYASWTQQSRHGDFKVRYGKWCQSEEEACAVIPPGCEGRVSSSDPKEDPYTSDDQRLEEDTARQWLATASRDTISGLLVRLRSQGFFKDKPLPGRIGDWSRIQAMTVHAASIVYGGAK